MAKLESNMLIFLLSVLAFSHAFGIRSKRSIDLSASHPLILDTKLTRDVIPKSYNINLRPNLEQNSFNGDIRMNLSWTEDTKKISLHAHYDLQINERSMKLKKYNLRNGSEVVWEDIPILRADRLLRKSVYVIYLKDVIKENSTCELYLEFEGYIWQNTEGLFKGDYSINGTDEKKTFIATYMRPNNARRVFPCFDEPGFKVPYTVSISRPKNFTTLFNTPLDRTETFIGGPLDYVVDYFVTTPPMPSFTFGFICSQLMKLDTKDKQRENSGKLTINIWGEEEIHHGLEEVYAKLIIIYDRLVDYFNLSLPLQKIDVLAIPGLSTVRPADCWGLLLFKESELLKNGYYGLTQELIYQWLGSWATPFWWSDAHVNKALASFLAAEIVIELDGGMEFNEKYPMTVLYSLYYEFSKRYPHSRITGMKQETTSFKTELVFRMLNYTIGKNTFRAGIVKFIADHRFGTFYGDDIWNSLTNQALLDESLNKQYSIAEIAGSWITKDRLPVITVNRNYESKTAKVVQKVYLRQRPHDVPEQDKMLWWIPLVLVRQDNMNFFNVTPLVWIDKTRELTLSNLPEANQFIIINPEEIGPFPVNYDEHNWNLLSTFLQNESMRQTIPTYTRAKLLHDAWNLAYAGDLSFATAFNMTLFIRHERNHVVWNPVFTFIDHIGRHIDMSVVHKKFETYVRVLLTPLYEELGSPSDTEPSWKTDLRTLARTFLCRAGYKPCIEEAQKAFQMWMEQSNPDEKNPVENQYICPVFKWGTMEEWNFGLKRVINFPRNRVQSERTYLLKTLSGCPVQREKIVQLLEITILEANGNFTENDIFLIFSMLTGGANGYMTLFTFLSENWVEIKDRFQNKTNLWDNLIGSATGIFTTNEGYEMVKALHEKHSGEFGSAEHIIEKSLRNIKEEAKWSDENLPVIENWLDNFLSTTGRMENKFLQKKKK